MVEISIYVHIQPYFLDSEQDVYFPHILGLKFLNRVVDAREGSYHILEFLNLFLHIVNYVLSLLILHFQLLDQLFLLFLVESNVDVH